MPGIDHTGNSEITALITSDPVKADELGTKYRVKSVFSYEQFQEALTSGTLDAIYLATPNWRHAEFIIPALKAGIHVLTENLSKSLRPSAGRSLTRRRHRARSSWLHIGFTLSRRHSTRSTKFEQVYSEMSICSPQHSLSWSILIIIELRMGSYDRLPAWLFTADEHSFVSAHRRSRVDGIRDFVFIFFSGREGEIPRLHSVK